MARERVVALLELAKDSILRVRADARASIGDCEAYTAGFGALHTHSDTALVGELHRIAREIEQHLAQPRRVAQYPVRQVVVEIGGDLDSLGLRARREQFDNVAHETR